MKYFRSILSLPFLYLFNTAAGFSQTCIGSLGDPVVNITFGAGNASTQPLSSSVTSYSFSAVPCPDDGFYSIGNQSQDCFVATWHSLPQDHTPSDLNGNMMLINASFTAGDFYKQRVSGLCAGTTYEFAAWILNILKSNSCNSSGIDPNITFSIETVEGEVIQTYNTKDIAETVSPEWKQFGFYFTAKTDEVFIRMTNNSLGGCGNDLALDDITFRACGPEVKADGKTASGNPLCEGDSGAVYLNATAPTGYRNPSYQWQVNNNDGAGWNDIPGATGLSYTQSIFAADAGGYQYRLAAAEGSNINSLNCRVVSEVIPVDVNGNPFADAGIDRMIDEGTGVSLNGKAEGNSLRYFWTPSIYLDNPNILNPTANPPESIVYTLHVVSDDGCDRVAEDEVSIRVLKKIVVPNAFTPNGDMVNDYWKITSLDTYPEARINVYNRYGQRVFKSLGYSEDWDGRYEGKPLPIGVYYYIIDLQTSKPFLKGSVSIIR